MENSLKEKLNKDLQEAVRQGEKTRRDCIRLILAAVKNSEIAHQTALTDSDVLSVIGKEARQREESIKLFKQGNRPDLAAQEETELAILHSYLPRQMSREEIAAEARKVIAEVGARGPADKGKVMPRLMAQLKGKADGRDINEVVTQLLSS